MPEKAGMETWCQEQIENHQLKPEIREAVQNDLDAIEEIYSYARNFMAEHGNPTQWGDGYPQEALILADIRSHQCFVEIIEGKIQAVFAFILGKDPTYEIITDGAWPDDVPYGTIHRIAAAQGSSKVFGSCFEFCKSRIATLRADTHPDNKIMQHVLEKHGFQRCGTIYVQDHSPRIAYQYSARSF